MQTGEGGGGGGEASIQATVHWAPELVVLLPDTKCTEKFPIFSMFGPKLPQYLNIVNYYAYVNTYDMNFIPMFVNCHKVSFFAFFAVSAFYIFEEKIHFR